MKIKMLITVIASLFIFGTSSIMAQPPSSLAPEKSKKEQTQSKERVEALKRSFVITESGMTPDEVTKFWPLYEEYLRKKRAIKGSESGSGAETDRARADLKDEYYDKYLEVMPKNKVDAVMKSLKDFRKKLAEILKNGGKLE